MKNRIAFSMLLHTQEDEDGFRKYAEIVKSMQSYQPDEAGKE